MLTVILIVSREVQVPFTIVQTKSNTPAVNPVTVDVGDDGVVIVAVLVVVHVPVPGAALFPARVVDVVLEHNC